MSTVWIQIEGLKQCSFLRFKSPTYNLDFISAFNHHHHQHACLIPPLSMPGLGSASCQNINIDKLFYGRDHNFHRNYYSFRSSRCFLRIFPGYSFAWAVIGCASFINLRKKEKKLFETRNPYETLFRCTEFCEISTPTSLVLEELPSICCAAWTWTCHRIDPLGINNS